MSDLLRVSPEEIEEFVGRPRHTSRHYARVVGGRVYVLHSYQCRAVHSDLTHCDISRVIGHPDFALSREDVSVLTKKAAAVFAGETGSALVIVRSTPHQEKEASP